MAVNLLDAVNAGIPGSFAAMAGGFLGESAASTGAALTGLLPVLLASLARNSETASGTKGVLAMLANPSVDTTILPNLNGIFSAGGAQANSMLSAGSALASSVFGGGLAPVTAALGSISGFNKPSSAQKLVALAVPIALAFLKRFVGANALSSDGLAALLASQRPFLEGALDARLTAAMGHADPAAMLATLQPATDHLPEVVADRAAGAATRAAPGVRARRSGFAQWWPWLAGAIVVLYVLSRFMGVHDTPGAPPAAAPAPGVAAPATPPAPGSGLAAPVTPAAVPANNQTPVPAAPDAAASTSPPAPGMRKDGEPTAAKPR